MKEEQLFRLKFNEIIKETAADYPPEPEEFEELNKEFDDTIIKWDSEISEQGVKTIIDDYSKCLAEHKKYLWKLKFSTIPDQDTKSEHQSKLFYYAATVKIEAFFIEYLESQFSNIVLLGPTDKVGTDISWLISQENKFIRGMSLQFVYDHFKALTEIKNKEGKYYLSESQLINFIKKGFLNDQSISKQKINAGHRDKGFIISGFYRFFTIAVSGDYRNKNDKSKFISLLSDCFSNWAYDEIVLSFRPCRSKETW